MSFLGKLPLGQTVSAGHFNRLVDEISRLRRQVQSIEESGAPALNVTGAFPIEVRRHPGGVHVSLAYGDVEAHVELTSDLTSGGSATAKVLWYDGAVWNQADTDEITVRDVVGTMEGVPGDKALVRFHRQSGLWIVWQLQC